MDVNKILRKVRYKLRKEGLYVTSANIFGVRKYFVVDEYNVIQNGSDGMCWDALARYAGVNI
jgi:hypothetical protein